MFLEKLHKVDKNATNHMRQIKDVLDELYMKHRNHIAIDEEIVHNIHINRHIKTADMTTYDDVVNVIL